MRPSRHSLVEGCTKPYSSFLVTACVVVQHRLLHQSMHTLALVLPVHPGCSSNGKSQPVILRPFPLKLVRLLARVELTEWTCLRVDGLIDRLLAEELLRAEEGAPDGGLPAAGRAQQEHAPAHAEDLPQLAHLQAERLRSLVAQLLCRLPHLHQARGLPLLRQGVPSAACHTGQNAARQSALHCL